MANVLSDEKKRQVLALGRLGWSLRKIEGATGIRRETASAYLRAASIAIRAPRQIEPPSKLASSEGLSTDSSAAATSWPPLGRAPAASACEPYREIIALAVGRGRNAMAIYQDLVTEHGLRAKYASVRRFVARLRGQKVPEAHVVIHTEGRPGRAGRLRRGADGAAARDRKVPSDAALRPSPSGTAGNRSGCPASSRARASGPSCTSAPFAASAGRRAWWSSTTCARGVIKADFYDPTLNPLYADVLRHYGGPGGEAPGADLWAIVDSLKGERSKADRAPTATNHPVC
jgi:hypothetical protein